MFGECPWNGANDTVVCGMTVPPSPNHALLVDHRVLDVVRGLHEPAQVVEDLLAEVREPGVMAPAQLGEPTLRNFH